MKILVVDDESIVLESCKRVLEDRFDVITAGSAHEALEAMDRKAVEIILLDVKMPIKDGISLLREIKERWPDIPVIVMSGYATKEMAEEISRTEAATFLEKPFTPDELLETLAGVIEKEGRP